MKKLAPALVPWYKENGRMLPWRRDTEPYHVWVSEIMLQQTRIEAVIPYYRRFMQELPDIRSLAEADPERLQKLWEGLGYYSRVRNLQKAAQQIMTEYGGEFPCNFKEIRELCGIGDYTAGAIGSICFGLPTPAVDGNVLRVLSRITGDARPVDDEKLKKEVRAELAEVYPPQDAGAFTQAIMELGEIICLPNGAPACSICPCRDFCESRDGGWDTLPVKAGKKPRRKEQLTVFVLRSEGRTALRKRPEKGLLSGLWELPNCAGFLTEAEAAAQAEAWNCKPSALQKQGKFTHIFTHIEWEMQCWLVDCAAAPQDFVWADGEQLEKEYSLPTAFRKILK